MAETVADIAIGLTADISPLMRETARAGKAVNKFGADMSRDVGKGAQGVQRALGQASVAAASFGKSFVSGLALGVVSAGMAAMTTNIRATIGAIADMVDESDRVGVSVENFQELQYGMKLAGVQADEFASGLSKFADNIGDAARGSGNLKNILEQNGIALRDVDGGVRGTTEILADFADMIQRVPDEATRMSLITEAFGKGGKAMTLALADGSAGLAEMQQAARDAGVVLDESVTRKAAELDDKFDALTARVDTFFKEVSVGAAGAALDLADMVNRLIVPDATGSLLGGLDAEGLLGADMAQQLRDNPAMMAAARDALLDYGAALQVIGGDVDTYADALGTLADNLDMAGAYDQSDAIRALGVQLAEARRGLDDGSVSGAAYVATLDDIRTKANAIMVPVSKMQGAQFEAAVSSAGDFSAAFDRLNGGMALAYNHLLAVTGLTPTMAGLAGEADELSAAFLATERQLRAVGETGAADLMRDLGQEVGDVSQKFRDGSISGDEMRGKLDLLMQAAGFAVDSLGDIDGVTFDNVRTGITGVFDYLVGLAAQAARTRAALAATTSPATIVGHGGRAEPSEYVSKLAPTVSVRPEQRGVDFDHDPPVDPETPDAPSGGVGPSSADLDALLASLETEKEILDGWYAESQAMLANATDAQLAQIGGRHEAIQRLEHEHQEKLAAIRGLGDGSALSNTASFFNSMATIAQAGGDKALKAYRVFAAGEALINTYRAQAQVLADKEVPFWGKFAAVAAIGAAGMGLVSALKGPGGGSSGGSARGGSGGVAAATPAVANITLNGMINDSGLRSLTERLNDEFKQGYVLNVVSA